MFDDEIEKAVLYYMIFEQEKFELGEKDFANDVHKKIIKAMNELKCEKANISMISVANKIKSNYTGAVNYIASLGDFILGTTAESAYGKLIEYSKKRQVYELLVDTVKKMKQDEGEEKTDVLIEKMIKSLQGIEQRNERTMDFKEQVYRTLGEIQNNYNNRADYSLYTGLVDLDKMMLGLHKQELTVVGARPRSGKDDAGVADCGAYCKERITYWICEF